MTKAKLLLLLLVLFLGLWGCQECPAIDECIECPDCDECEECPINNQCPVTKQVFLGIDNIDDNLNIFAGKRVGLITNQTGVNKNLETTIDILYEKTNLVSLFAPEHGIRGNYTAGDTVGGEIDPVTMLPVYSLYGSTKTPTKAMMDTIDILAIDIQDVGARFYTYVYTMAYAMQACKQYNKPFVVFDRPNPVGGTEYEGNILDTNYASFIGLYPIIQRHGLTIGELALLFNTEYNINCSLTIIKMTNWDRSMYFEDTSLPWVIPSPNMPTPNTALVYSGTCLFEGTNLSEGRGTTLPFELIGAPYIDAFLYADALNQYNLSGVYFRATYFTPTTSKNANKLCGGVQVHITDKKAFQSVKTALVMLDVVRTMYPNDFQVLSSLYNLTGCSYIPLKTLSLEQQLERIVTETNQFQKTRQKYLLY